MGRSGRSKGRVQGGFEYPTPDFHVAGQKPLYLCEPFVRNALIKGSFRTIVALPRYVHPYEWIANNLFDFFNNLNLFYGIVSEFCTVQTDPTMAVGVGIHYTWVDMNRKPIPLPAPQYIDFVMTWMGRLFDDEAVFPTKAGRDFPQSFLITARQMYEQMLRIFAHIYYAHYEWLVHLSCEGHFNSLFAHFIAFGKEFSLFNFAEFKGSGNVANGAPSSMGGVGGPETPAVETPELRDLAAAHINAVGERVPYPGVCDLVESWVAQGVLSPEVLQ